MIEAAGFRILFQKNHTDTEYRVLHNPRKSGEKILSGTLTQSLSGIDTVDFTIPLTNKYYNDIQPINSLIRVINVRDGKTEFYGRVLTTNGETDGNGISKSYTCESILGYFHDSTQTFRRIRNTTVYDYLKAIVDYHNDNVEPHKRFKIGNVTVQNQSDIPTRYIGYETTFDTIKNDLIGKMGGYIRLRIEDDGNYIDYLEDVGVDIDSPIQLGKNIVSARRELNLDGLLTQIVPIGSDLDTGQVRDDDNGQFVIRERVGIESVNGGVKYLQDDELVKEFGVIQKPVNWTNISSPHILKIRAQQYLDNQKVAMASWTIESVELYLIDNRFKKYEVGNKHPIINPPLTSIEKLQIIKKKTDLLNPHEVSLDVGSSAQSLSAYQLQQQEAKKSMEKAFMEEMAKRKEQEKVTNEITLLQAEVKQIEWTKNSELQEIQRIQGQIDLLNAQKRGLDPVEDVVLIRSLDTQISSFANQKTALEAKQKEYTNKITELNEKIKVLQAPKKQEGVTEDGL